MRTEYRREQLGRATRGKYFARYTRGTNLVRLDDRVAQAFPDSQSVNAALLALLAVAEQANVRPRRPRKRSG